MPWRFIVFIVVLIVFLFFIGFNLENKCVISFGFGTGLDTPPVPVFFPILISFALGVLVSLPIVLSINKKRARLPEKEVKPKEEKKEVKPEDIGKEPNEPPPGKSGGNFFKRFKRNAKK